MNTTTPNRYSAPALEKGLDILEALAQSEDGYTLNELARTLGRNVNEIFRMVMTLQHRGYIQQAEPDDRYTLSMRLFQLAHYQQPIKSLLQAALPLLKELAERSRQSCHLSLFRSGRMVIVAQIDSPERWSFGLRVGEAMGLTDTSSGHVILAYQDEVERTRMLSSHIKVEGELQMDPGELFSILKDVRAKGYASMPSIQIGGITNIAFPVFSNGGRVVAAINVPHIARIDGMPRPDIEQIKEIMSSICLRLSTRIGYNPDASDDMLDSA
ncbi:IclR family transcriptional regulator [Allopusillimonas ginsengisoli]|uniref:IclR family transcriptional regulator n=1 Tax=Allopusillimonas ginsengisoli TaxID=453575 RepID=UPI00101F1C13|nr:IclR family transcriptional regulator [Allopusillimonas ginsengisoli]TEA70335.1 IclR family transcriptional regulator [Allopusillimonas ginsengisoli]